ncbi:3-hydroxyacyl-CoA dehydrogenase NAD-binding domain-containing protein [Fulvivirga ulvae]|uniref:3-hydroxyacyl-CoA dehydrogenase NAD-binding domain-containing protein n=1 Tax=Fulvivirga ulvae TaxID=2904245 RepID=UPI001F18BDCD|nr:3-hydroxyacyl-CoA dehydrogenase NAD-binding domain-containing protein [Fulvivirga ulvae]UII34288.1 3-hydroxyacyl-CoA dehydrogenase NAD-binding domain-containing protein [Fulvivirga ulvae]
MDTTADIKSIAIIGAGTMGQGIAQIAAMAGYRTVLFDIEKDALEKALKSIEKNLEKGIEKGKVTQEQRKTALGNISAVTDLDEVKADFIIEAIVERLDVKQKVFAELERINSKKTILASNTSSIPITQIGAGLKHPERFVGMHFFNPAHIMKLVEVISGAATDDKTAMLTKELAENLGKVAVMAKDSPGFIVNRVARHFYVEGLKVLEEGVAGMETIDTLVQSSGFKMGPFQLMDLIGVDTNFSVTTSMYNSFYQDAKFRPSRIQQQKVDAGHHGRKSGKGFYNYE